MDLQQSWGWSHILAMRLQHYLDSNPDFRRQPKTERYCWRCQKDLGANQPARFITFTADGEHIIHPADIDQATATLGAFPVGLDCAAKIGMDWSQP